MTTAEGARTSIGTHSWLVERPRCKGSLRKWLYASLVLSSVLSLCLLLLRRQEGHDEGQVLAVQFAHRPKTYPTTDQEHQGIRVLYMTASDTTKQYLELWTALQHLVDICNAGYDVDIALQIAAWYDRTTGMEVTVSESFTAPFDRRLDGPLSQ